jgi:hypothetical protein
LQHAGSIFQEDLPCLIIKGVQRELVQERILFIIASRSAVEKTIIWDVFLLVDELVFAILTAQ